MSNSSTLSRVFLGVLLTVAIVLIIVVASSRPTDSEQNTPLLTANGSGAGANDDADPAPAAADADSQAAPDVAADSPPAPADDNSMSSTQNASDATTAKETATGPHGDPPVKVDPTAMDAAKGDDSRSAEEGTGSGITGTTEPHATPGESADSAAKESIDIARKSIVGWDPLQRLSREFARRAAYQGNVRPKATPVEPPADEIFPPSVVMSDEHRKTCLVFVGDTMPNGQLKDAEGQEHSVTGSADKALTVIVFWNAADPYALDQFEELPNDLVPFAELGVQTIAIHVGPLPENYHQLVEQYGKDVLCLADPDRAYFRKVSTGGVPRTYLLGADGKIIWLDIEYSRTTRYDLRNALHYSLKDE